MNRETHTHVWRVVSYEALSQTVGYRCPCGAERFDPPRDETPADAAQDFDALELEP